MEDLLACVDLVLDILISERLEQARHYDWHDVVHVAHAYASILIFCILEEETDYSEAKIGRLEFTSKQDTAG